MRKTEIKPTVKYSQNYYNGMFRLSHYMLAGDVWTALVWSYFEFTHNMKADDVKKAKKNHKPIPTLWQWQTNKEITKHIGIPKDNIRYAIDKLTAMGVIQLWDYGIREGKTDPNDKRKGKIKLGKNPIGKIDQRRWLIYNVEVAQALIECWENNNENLEKYKVFKQEEIYSESMINLEELKKQATPSREINQKFINLAGLKPSSEF